MKKNLVVLLCVLLSCVVLVGLFSFTLDVKELYKYFETTEYKYQKDTSVFVGELNDSNGYFTDVKVKKRSGPVWIVEDKDYQEQKTEFNIVYDPTVNWRVDLSALKPCGEYKEFKIYSSTGKCNNDVLVAVKNGKKFLLVASDVLSPYQYTCDDFELRNLSDNDIVNYVDKVWEDHLGGEHESRYLLNDDTDAIQYVEFHLKSQPELYYPLSFVEYQGNYKTRLPFHETSNGYYDISERIKDGLKDR